MKPYFCLFFLIVTSHAVGMTKLSNSKYKQVQAKLENIYSSWIRDNEPTYLADGYVTDSEIDVELPHDLKRKPSLLDCTERKYIAEQWAEHPYKGHHKSSFHHYTENNRRKSLPPSFVITMQKNS